MVTNPTYISALTKGHPNMKKQLKRRLIILFSTVLIVAGISNFLNKASFDPNFSVADAVTGATKRAHKKSSKSDTVTVWDYSADDLALPDITAYSEETIITEKGSYVLLRKSELSQDTLIILSDKDNRDYAKAVEQAAKYYEDLGYTIEIRKYSETMMLSLAHAEHFDLFLLREEAVE